MSTTPGYDSSGFPGGLIKHGAVAGCLLVVMLGGCDSDATNTTSLASSTTTSAAPPTTLATTTAAPTTTEAPTPDPAAFVVPVGENGLSYDLDGDPPSGPTSFTVMDDGTVVIADTVAMRRGEPRLLRFSASGARLEPFNLAEYDVAAIVDVVALSNNLAVLDVFVAMDRYRILILDGAGNATKAIDIPAGLRFEAGLTGLVADDDGLMLEYELGSRYVRVSETGEFTTDAVPAFRGSQVLVTTEPDRKTQLNVGMDSYKVTRLTDLGGVRVLGVAPNGTTLIVIDEVDMSESAIRVTRRVQRRSPDGDVLGEAVLDVADQYVEIARPLEVGPTGAVLYLLSAPDHLQMQVLDL